MFFYLANGCVDFEHCWLIKSSFITKDEHKACKLTRTKVHKNFTFGFHCHNYFFFFFSAVFQIPTFFVNSFLSLRVTTFVSTARWSDTPTLRTQRTTQPETIPTAKRRHHCPTQNQIILRLPPTHFIWNIWVDSCLCSKAKRSAKFVQNLSSTIRSCLVNI